MPIHKTEALVIKRSDFRETSMIARFYSREFGKMSGILKGIRQEPGKFASTLEPFSHNDLIFYKKRNSTLHLVSHCETRENFDLIRQNLAKANAAHLVIELIDAIMQEEDKNEEVFDLALLTLRELTTNYNADKIMTIFKIKILALSGFKPHFDSCVSCGDRILGQSKFSVSQGGLLCSRCYKKI